MRIFLIFAVVLVVVSGGSKKTRRGGPFYGHHHHPHGHGPHHAGPPSHHAGPPSHHAGPPYRPPPPHAHHAHHHHGPPPPPPSHHPGHGHEHVVHSPHHVHEPSHHPHAHHPPAHPPQSQAYVLSNPAYAYLAQNLVPLSGLGPVYSSPQVALTPIVPSVPVVETPVLEPVVDYGPAPVPVVEPLPQVQLQDDAPGASGSTQISKSVYVFSAPPDPFENTQPQFVRNIPGPRQKHYQVVFINAPSPPKPPQHTVELPPPPELKTQIYVLVKKPHASPPLKIIPSKVPINKPEVYFIRYKNKDGHGAPHGHHDGSSLGGYGDPLPASEDFVRIPGSSGVAPGYGVPEPEYESPSSGISGGYDSPSSGISGGYESPSSGISGGYESPSSGGYDSPSSSGYDSSSDGYESTSAGGYDSPSSGGYGGPSEYKSPASEYQTGGRQHLHHYVVSDPSTSHGSEYSTVPEDYSHSSGPSSYSHSHGASGSGDMYSDYTRLSAHYTSLQKLTPPKKMSNRAWKALKTHATAIAKKSTEVNNKKASARIDNSKWTPIISKTNKELDAGMSGI